MAALINLPTIDLDALAPERMSLDIMGSGIEGGRNGLGESNAIEFAGGGLVTCTYDACFIQEREHHALLNRYAGRLNGSYRNIVVPLLTDWIAGIATAAGIAPLTYIQLFDPDGSLVDGPLAEVPIATAIITEAAALGAGKVKLKVTGANNAFGPPGWFSIYHPVKGYRAYRVWDVIGTTGSSSEPIYEVAIGPQLRQAVAANTAANLVRPKFVGRFPSGFTLPWEPEGLWTWRPTLKFVEAF